MLQPTNVSAHERQKGFIGNSIFLPQARPSKVLSTLPPDMAETILFVLAGGKKQQFRRSGVLEAPRQEYVNAVRTLQEVSMYYSDVPLSEECSNTDDLWQQCVLETEDRYLARELLQKGPAEAQGQQEGDPEIDEAEKAHEESGALPKKEFFLIFEHSKDFLTGVSVFCADHFAQVIYSRPCLDALGFATMLAKITVTCECHVSCMFEPC